MSLRDSVSRERGRTVAQGQRRRPLERPAQGNTSVPVAEILSGPQKRSISPVWTVTRKWWWLGNRRGGAANPALYLALLLML